MRQRAVLFCLACFWVCLSSVPARAQHGGDSTNYFSTTANSKYDEENWSSSSIRSFGKTAKIPANSSLVLGLATQKFVCPCEGEFLRGVSKRHDGLDIKLAKGTPVKAAFEGIVRYARRNRGGYGNLVILRHENGLETYYAHLSAIRVDENERIRAGQVVGLGGSTGRTRGPHLHFELRYHDLPVDPLKILDYYGTRVIADTVTIGEVSNFKAAHRSRKAWRKSAGKSAGGGYTLRQGDTLYDLAKRHKTSVKKLCEINKINPKSVLRAGEKLKIK